MSKIVSWKNYDDIELIPEKWKYMNHYIKFMDAKLSKYKYNYNTQVLNIPMKDFIKYFNEINYEYIKSECPETLYTKKICDKSYTYRLFYIMSRHLNI
jgi:hypothetical protein